LVFHQDFSWNVVSVIAYELPWYMITPIIGYRAPCDDYCDGSGNNRFENGTWMHGTRTWSCLEILSVNKFSFMK
jgi:hypothetical protein